LASGVSHLALDRHLSWVLAERQEGVDGLLGELHASPPARPGPCVRAGRHGARLAVTGLSLSEADAVVRLALGQHVDPAELAVAAAPLGGAGKRIRMIGADGVQVTSKELTRGKGWRMHLENPNPGQLPAQMHIQDYRGNEWQYDFDTRRFMGLPKMLEKEIMHNRRVLVVIERALASLGETP
jgi:hypothetical protein